MGRTGDPGPRGVSTAGGPLVEREQELAEIDTALEAATAGEGRLLIVEGHAGIGKSGLLAAARAQATRDNATVLSGLGSSLEGDHAFGVVMQLFEPAVAEMDSAGREHLLSGAASLARPLFEGGAAGSASPDDQIFTLLHGLHWLTANLTERGSLLIAADDIHWADRPSLRFFLYLAQRLRDLPVVVCAAVRVAEPGAPEDLLRQLRTAAVTKVLRPAALSRGAVASLVERRLPGAEQPFVDACLAVTEGNPFLLSELLADVRHRRIEPTAVNAQRVGLLAPESVLDAAVVRLARLPDGAAEMARAVAILGDDAQPAHATALAGLEPDAAAPVIDALDAAEILRAREPLAFAHPLLQSAIYADIPPIERGRAHRRAAELLDARGADAEKVAAHLMVGNRAGQAWSVDRLRAAASRSVARGAPESAVRYLTRALEEPPPVETAADVLLELGEAEGLAGSPDGLTRLERALDLLDDPRRRAAVLERIGWMLQQSGDMPRAVVAFGRGLSELEALDEDESAARLRVNLELAQLGEAILQPGPIETIEKRVRPILEKPQDDVSEVERGVLALAAMKTLMTGERHDLVTTFAEHAWGGGALLEQAGLQSPMVWHVIGCMSWADALILAERAIELTFEAADADSSIVSLALGFYSRAWPRYWRGDLRGAVADARAAVDAWSAEFTMYLPIAASWMALAYLELGDVESAAAAVDFPEASERWSDGNMWGALLTAQGLVQMARGDHRGAGALFEQAGSSVMGTMVSNPAMMAWRGYLATVRLAEGDRAAALELAQEEVALARKFGAARPVGMSLRVAGLVEGGAEGIALLEESVATLRRSPASLELTRSLVDLGAEQRRQGYRSAAREHLREAIEAARAQGAVVLERRAADELRAAGGRPRKPSDAGVDALTPSERRVADLAASGMTNREIAQTLFVTVKAVQFHLGNTYRKLEISSRDELPAALQNGGS